MIRISLIIMVLATAVSCKNASEQKNEQTADTVATAATEPSLEKLWETDTVFTTSESVLFDKDQSILFVSNIIGDPTGKDGKGSISRLNTDGSVENLEWATGLNAPKGMAILNDKLYVTDIDELVEINLSDGKISNKYKVDGAVFLNDAATNGEDVYFSDTRTGKIHALQNGKIKLIAENHKGINGLEFTDKGELLVLDAQGVSIDPLNDEDPKKINEQVTGGDGVVIINDSTYLVSRWKGEIYLIQNGKEKLLLDTQAENSNTADIGYIPEENVVLVPTFKANKVVAYKVNY